MYIFDVSFCIGSIKRMRDGEGEDERKYLPMEFLDKMANLNFFQAMPLRVPSSSR
jgi:hypothetical protein